MNIQLETKFGEISPEQKALPFASMLPKDEVGLLKWRIYVRERCLQDRRFRDEILQMCRYDVAFFVLTFGWMHETRQNEKHLGEFPAFLDPDQIDLLAWFEKYAGRCEITVEKTRGIGLSYLIAFFCAHTLLFDRHSPEIAVLSKDETSLDQYRRPSTLLGKIDLMLEKLPKWMTCNEHGEPLIKRTINDHKFVNLKTNTALLGLVPTNEKTRSGRYRYIFIDEAAFLPIEEQKWLAAAFGTSPSTIWVSTHNGTANLFFRMSRDEESDLIRIATWWWENQRCRAGLYKITSGQIDILDHGYKFPHGYFEHKTCWEHQGVLRSPWVDRQFRRPRIDPARLFEELYGVTGAESRRLLRSTVFSITRRTTTKRPLAIGFISDDGEWVDDSEGHIKFWVNPGRLDSLYCLGVDPSLSPASGAYAAASAMDMKTGEQIMTARLRDVGPTEFPIEVERIGRFLSGASTRCARIAFESTGIGVVFKDGMQQLRYPALLCEPGKTEPGFHNQDNGAAWLLELGRGIIAGEFVPRDAVLVDELPGFEYDTKWDLVYAPTDGHGDLAIATALSWLGGRDTRRIWKKKLAKQSFAERDPAVLAWNASRRSWLYSDQFR